MAIGLRAHVLPLLCVFVVFRTLTTDQSQATSNDFFPFFIAGMGVAAIVEGRLREASAAIFVAFLVEFYHLHFGFAQPSVPMITSRSLLLCAGTAAMYFAATYRPSPQMESLLRPLSFIGLISYPLYLIHQDVGNMILRWASVDTAVTSASLLMRLLLIAGMMALASLVYFVFERRSTKVITDLLATPAAWNSKRKIPAGPPERECKAGLVNFGPQRDHIGC